MRFRVRFGLAGLAVVALCAGGCASRGAIKVISADLRKIADDEPFIHEIEADRAYHWLDAEGRLCVALAQDRPSLLGDGHRRKMWLSLVLGKPPSGAGRTYRANTRTLRMVARMGYDHSRWASYGGVVTVSRLGDGRLKGRLRVSAKQQGFSILTGWKGNGRALLVGEFTADASADVGERILLRTEADGMDRPPARGKALRGDSGDGATVGASPG